MRVLVADAFPDSALARIAEHGHDCAYRPELAADTLADGLAGFDVLVVRSTPVTASALACADELKVVLRAGSGTNTIDCAAASSRGVGVCNVPGRNAVAVAELAFGLLLALDRNIPDNVIDLRAGRWRKQRYAHARGISGRRVGVVGLGQVGLAFAERVAAFDADPFAVHKAGRSPEVVKRAERIGVHLVENLDVLAETCDVLSFHVPGTAATRNLIGRDLLARVQPATILLNTARGQIIDEDALIEAMDTKDVRAGIDVYRDEPPSGTGTIGSRLARHPNVYGTHHIGASTTQAQQAVAAEAVRMIDDFEAGLLPHCVNLDAVRRAREAATLGYGGS